MPIYEYRCLSCESTFEKLMKMKAEAPPCPECGHTEVKKLVSASGFILKGSGWYKDHYGLKSSSDSKDSSSGDKGSSSGDKGSSSGDKSSSSGDKSSSSGDKSSSSDGGSATTETSTTNTSKSTE